MKRFVYIILFLIAGLPIMAQSFTYIYKGVEFKGKINKGEACIKSFNNKVPEVTIPASISFKGSNYPVKTVSVFMNGVNYSTQRLILEEGIEDIDKFCFNEFRKLLSVNLPSSLRHIGKNAFRDNRNLTLNMLSSIDEGAIRSGAELYPDGSGTMVSKGYNNAPQYASSGQSNHDETKALKEQLKEQERMLKQQQELLAKATTQNEKNNQKEETGNDGGIINGIKGLFGKKNKKNKKNEGSIDSYNNNQKIAHNPEPQKQNEKKNSKQQPESFFADVDINIPVVQTQKNANTYCVIIANEKYEDVPEVEYAERDGKIFQEYCIKTLGIPEKQIRSFINASYTDIKRALNWIETMADIGGGNAKILFYYAGHGIPNEKDKTAYLIPTDGFPKDVTTCFKLSELYARLGKMKTESVTVLLDACFSGVKRGSGQALVAARGVAIKPKDEVLSGNMVVFTAASDDETALAYKEKRHGMFTYFLLDNLKKSQGNASFGEIFKSLSMDVKKNSMLENDKLQTPSVNVSTGLKLKWEKMRF